MATRLVEHDGLVSLRVLQIAEAFHPSAAVGATKILIHAAILPRATDREADLMHVDLFVNEWTTGRQRKVARVTEIGGRLVTGDSVWTERLRLLGLGSLQEVTGKYGRSTYVTATEPHEDDDCAFRDTLVLPMKITRP